MGVINKYQILENDLYLTEHLDWSFIAHKPDATCQWLLLGIDKAKLDLNKLEKLVSYGEDADILETKRDGKDCLVISTYFDDGEYIFDCEKIVKQFRPLNAEELTDIITSRDKLIDDLRREISKHQNSLGELKGFIEKEIDRKKKVIDAFPDTSTHNYLKSKSQLDAFNKVSVFLENNS